jgi:hypothetical protein
METLDEMKCPRCGRVMRLVGSEQERRKPGVIIHTYECGCGEAVAIEDANN